MLLIFLWWCIQCLINICKELYAKKHWMNKYSTIIVDKLHDFLQNKLVGEVNLLIFCLWWRHVIVFIGIIMIMIVNCLIYLLKVIANQNTTVIFQHFWKVQWLINKSLWYPYSPWIRFPEIGRIIILCLFYFILLSPVGSTRVHWLVQEFNCWCRGKCSSILAKDLQ